MKNAINFLKSIIKLEFYNNRKIIVLENKIKKQEKIIKSLENLNRNLYFEDFEKRNKQKIRSLENANKEKDKQIEALKNQITEMKLKLMKKRI